MKKIELNGQWTLTGEGISVSATVPGCVHTDLISAGVIKDIFYRDENEKYKWIEDKDWEYSCTFDSITLRAEKYLHAVELEGEYLFDDNCFSMLEGETRKIGFECIGDNGFDIRAYSFL